MLNFSADNTVAAQYNDKSSLNEDGGPNCTVVERSNENYGRGPKYLPIIGVVKALF